MGDELNKKEQPNSIKKKRVGGIKSLLEVRNCSFISVLFSYSLLCLLAFIRKREIGHRGKKN